MNWIDGGTLRGLDEAKLRGLGAKLRGIGVAIDRRTGTLCRSYTSMMLRLLLMVNMIPLHIYTGRGSKCCKMAVLRLYEVVSIERVNDGKS